MTEDELPEDLKERILSNIEEFGCHITCVAPPDDEEFDDEDEGDERFAYSVGFPLTVSQPEVIVFGFSPKLSASVINGVLDQAREGLVLDDWIEVDGLLEGHRCVLREVEPDHLVPYYFNSALWFAQETTDAAMPRALQIVWPDAEWGLFPWQRGCPDAVRELQPPLYRTSLNS